MCERSDIVENILNIAKYILDEYKKISGTPIDEMKLHKLLYFTQRESLAITGEAMFVETFEGWKFGPVSRLVRDHFDGDDISVSDKSEISDEAKYIANNVIQQYAGYESWKLSELSHNEYSWKQSRIGIQYNENGSNIIKLEDIRKDAEKVRPYDSLHDMYYDEFEDAEELV